MWEKKVSITTRATREQVWRLWSDVSSWERWDDEVEFATLEGLFQVGAVGKLKPKGAPKSSFMLTEVTPNHSFTSRSVLPLTKIDFIHELTEDSGQLYITHRIEVRGALTFLFSRLIGEKLVSTLPDTLETLSNMAERKVA